MKYFIRLSLLLIFIMSSFTLSHASKNKTVYAFTYGICFNDSVTYMSAVQVLPEAQIESKTNFLADRSLYSNQLKQYLDKQFGGSHTCAILFGAKKEQVEKKYAKLRRSFQKGKKGKLIEIAANEFKLSAVTTPAETN